MAAFEALKAEDEAIRALNNDFAAETSFLTQAEWATLVVAARFGFIAPSAEGFLIALSSDSAYAGLNFQWFRARYDRFAYVDRIVIAASAHGRGLGRALYEQLFHEASAAGCDKIACEVNIDPPNPASIAFHEKLRFVGVGDRVLPNGKAVRYFIRTL